MNQLATAQHTGGFESLSGGGMAPMTPMAPQMGQPLGQPVQPSNSTSPPVFTSQPQNLMFGVQPLSLQNNQNNKNNPFNF